MNMPLSNDIQRESMALNPQEARMVKTLRLLQEIEPTTADQLEETLWKLVGQYLKWSYDDPASLEVAAQFMGLDPYLKRESDLITAETEGRA